MAPIPGASRDNIMVTEVLQQAGLATLLFDLLTEQKPRGGTVSLTSRCSPIG